MGRKQQGRKFPYYIVIGVDTSKLKINILDLNSIQNGEKVDGKFTSDYVRDGHDSKWIDVPGSTKTAKEATIKWINNMVFPDGEAHSDKYMIYDHRRHNTDPFHEEYIVDVFREYLADIAEEAETEEEVEEDSDDADEVDDETEEFEDEEDHETED